MNKPVLALPLPKEPLARIAKREAIGAVPSVLIRIGAVILALLVNAALIYTITKLNPIDVYKSMWQGAFGTSRRVWKTLYEVVMLLCIAVGLAPAFKMRFWNIGAEGQVLVGGIASAACMIYLPKMLAGSPLASFIPQNILILICMFITSCAAGAVWGLVPAFFKAKFNTNETLFTLMMNYVAIRLTSYYVARWENPPGSNTVGVINSATKEGWFPTLFGQGYMLSVIIVAVVTVAVFFYLKYSKHGYEIAVVGESENTARYAGINVKKVVIRTMLISGALCGLAGFIGVGGADHSISVNTAGGRGFTAIIVAWLAKFNTLTMVLISTLIIFLNQGAGQIVTDFSKLGINNNVADIIKGVILFFILASEFFINYRLIFRVKKHKHTETPKTDDTEKEAAK